MRKCARRFLISTSNWNNTDNAEVANRNANNVLSKSNHNNGARVKLRAIAMSYFSPEQHFNLHLL